MGNCGSKPQSGPKAGGNPGLQKKRKLTATGIMDENAPETTAPKIDMNRPDMQRLLERMLDMFRGEVQFVTNRIPSTRSDIRWYLYTQVIAAVRDVVHRLNESCDLETDQPMPPSQVIDILNVVRTTLNDDEGYDLPAVTIRNANIVNAFKERVPYLEAWLLISSQTEETVMNRQELGTYCSKVPLSFPHDLLVGETFSYNQLMELQLSYSKKILSTVYDLFAKYSPKGLMTAANFVSYGGSKKDFMGLLASEGLLKIQYEVFSVREFSLYYNTVQHNNGLIKNEISQDMNQPLCSYMISASSNSWLVLRDVLTGDSSVDQLRKILLSGCRHIELECNDGPEGTPIVCLSWTKNKSLPLDKCLEVINQYAFTSSPYPIILSVAFHFGLESDGWAQMQATSALIKGTFKDKLALWGDDREPPELLSATPEKLKNKIIVLCEKRLQEIGPIARSTKLRESGNGPTDLGLGLVNVKNKLGVKVKTVREGSIGHKSGITEGSFIEKIDGSNGTEKISVVNDLMKALLAYRSGDDVKLMVDQRYLSVCIGGCETLCNVKKTEAQLTLPFGYDSSDEEKPEPVLKMKYDSLFAREKQGHRYKRIPISEDLSSMAYMRRERVTAPDLDNTLASVAPPWWDVVVVPVDLVDAVCIDEILKTALVSVIPSKDSLLSENYNPYWLWERGVQLTCLNRHNFDSFFRIQQARFKENSQSGYILKQTGDTKPVCVNVVVHYVYNPPEQLLKSNGQERAFQLSIRLSSQRLEDTDRTPPSPELLWEHEKTVHGTNMALEVLLITLFENDQIVTECAVPVNMLKEGTHALELQDPSTGEAFLGSSIMCTIDFE